MREASKPYDKNHSAEAILGELEHLWAEYTGGHLGGSEFNDMVCDLVAEKIVPRSYTQSAELTSVEQIGWLCYTETGARHFIWKAEDASEQAWLDKRYQRRLPVFIGDCPVSASATRSDTERLDWLEAWHQLRPNEKGYGDVGTKLVDRASDGWLLDDEAGGGGYETLRDAIDAAIEASRTARTDQKGDA